LLKYNLNKFKLISVKKTNFLSLGDNYREIDLRFTALCASRIPNRFDAGTREAFYTILA